MKYILKKKWHESQVEEVGHVFEGSRSIFYNIPVNAEEGITEEIFPHEIALLVDAGYLEKEKEKELQCLCYPWHTGKKHQDFCPIKEEKEECVHTFSNIVMNHPSGFGVGDKMCTKCNLAVKEDPPLDLWTTEPPEESMYWFVTDEGEIARSLYFMRDEADKFRLRTNNCHKTQKSAEEALKRLLEKE